MLQAVQYLEKSDRLQLLSRFVKKVRLDVPDKQEVQPNLSGVATTSCWTWSNQKASRLWDSWVLIGASEYQHILSNVYWCNWRYLLFIVELAYWAGGTRFRSGGRFCTLVKSNQTHLDRAEKSPDVSAARRLTLALKAHKDSHCCMLLSS